MRQDPVERTLPRFLERAAAAWGDKPLVRFPETVVTYRDLAERAALFAGALQRVGVAPKDTVLIIASNRWEYLEAWWGICLLGAIEVPVNFGLRGKLLAHVLRDCQARVAIIEAAYLSEVEAVLEDVPSLETIILIGEPPRTVKGRQVLGFDTLPRGRPELPPVRHGDVAAIMYTSGSTGPAKGAMLSHNFFLRFGEEKAKHVRSGSDDVIYNCYPLFNLSGQTEAVVTAMCAGASVSRSRA